MAGDCSVSTSLRGLNNDQGKVTSERENPKGESNHSSQVDAA